MTNELSQFLTAFGCMEIYPLDGNIHRFDRNGTKSGWFWGVEAFKLDNGEMYKIVLVGDWNGSERQKYKTNAILTTDQRRVVSERLKELKKLETEKRREIHAESAGRAGRIFESAASVGRTSYLDRKSLSGLYGARVVGNDLLVPTRDGAGALSGFQRILPDGKKFFCTGQRKYGCFHTIPADVSSDGDRRIFIVEGFATGVSVHEATKTMVVIAFDGGNLKPVAQIIRKNNPGADIVICADDDKYKDPTKNPGVEKAKEAAHAISGRIIIPVFKSLDSQPTDFNDLYILEGKEVVAQQLSAEASELSGDENYLPFKLFFDQHFAKARKDIVSNEFLMFDGRYWNSPLNHVEAVKSYAEGIGLSASKTPMHLDRYILEKPPELLIDIPAWDGVDHIKGLYQFIKFKDRGFSEFEMAFKEWGANVFRRLYNQNAQNRCIILKGDQGIGKDSFIRSLLSGFENYYQTFTTSHDDREIWDQVTESLILHVEEFDQTEKMRVSFLKDIISRGTAKYRSSYGRRQKARKCHASFIASVNIEDILRDETGSRRFAVYEVESVNWDYPKNLGGQILAQFYALFQEDFWAPKSTWDAVSKRNEKFQVESIVNDLLDMWDIEVARVCRNLGRLHLSFGQTGRLVSDLTRATGLKPIKIMKIIGENGRSEKVGGEKRYYSNIIKGLPTVKQDGSTILAKKPSSAETRSGQGSGH